MKKYLLFILIISGLVLPMFVRASILSGPIVPCGGEGDECTLCDIFVMAKNVIDFFMLIIFFVAGLFIVIGGIRMLTSAGSPEHVDRGKRMITYAVTGVIIALVSWILLAELFIALVGEQTAEEGNVEQGFPWPWNEIQCVGGGVTEPPETSGEYCVCTIPRYSISPSIIERDIKVNHLTSADTCKQDCVVANANSYCPNSSLTTLSEGDYGFSCVDQTYLGSLQVCRLRFEDYEGGCRVGTTCYASDNDCMDASTGAYVSQCNLDGNSLCNYPGSTFCPTGTNKPGPCASNQYLLYKWQYERFYNPSDKPEGADYNAYECSQTSYGSSGLYCRMNCGLGQYAGCAPPPGGDRCDEMSPPKGQTAACSGGLSGFTCQQGVNDQWGDACVELQNFLNCMKNLPTSTFPTAARVISSISDNSPPLGGSLPGCFQTYASQCSGATDSCTGTCCGHRMCSLHYGGRRRTNFGPSGCELGSVDCRSCSFAVDFAEESYETQIRTAATQCAEQLWDGALDDIYVDNEGNHIHVGLNGIADYHQCLQGSY
jgi:hypothetical protein